MTRNLVRGFLSIFSAKVATSAITIVTLPILVRLLGPGAYGDYAFLMALFSLLMIFVSSGVTEGLQKFAAEQRDDHWRANVIGFYARIALVLAVAGAAVLAATTRFGVVGETFGSEFTVYFYLLSAFIITAQFREFGRRSLLSFGLEHYSEPLSVLSKVVWVTVSIWLVVQGYGVAGVLFGNVLASGVITVISLTIIFRRVSVREVLTFPTREFPRRELLSFNVLNIVLVLLTMSLYHVDVVMLRTLAGSTQTGYYRSALAIAEYLWFVSVVLHTLLLHSTSDLWSEGNHERVRRLSTQITRYSLLLTLLLAIGIAALADRVVPLYFGADFAPAVLPLLLLLPGAVGFAAVRPLTAIGQGQGNLKPLIAATGTAAVLNLALNALLIPSYGMVGAAVATSIGYGSMFFAHILAARHLGYSPLGDLRVIRVALTALLAAGPIFGLSRILHSDLLAVIVVPPIGFIIFVGLAVFLGALDAETVFDVLERFPAPLDRVPVVLRRLAAV